MDVMLDCLGWMRVCLLAFLALFIIVVVQNMPGIAADYLRKVVFV